MKSILTTTLAAVAAACATPQGPDAELVRTKPVHTIGEPKPATDDYILRVPRGAGVPVTLSLLGGPLAAPAVAHATASSRRDLYLYKQWFSYDGLAWKPLKQGFGLELSSGLDTRGASFSIHLIERHRSRAE